MKHIKKLLVLTVLIIILIGYVLNVRANSFEFGVVPEKDEFAIGNTVKVDMRVSQIKASDGINVVEAELEYDDNLFESVTFDGKNQWKITYNEEENGKGKFIATKLVKGVTKEEKIGQIQLKLKSDIEETKTEVKINKITSNDGTKLINVGNKSAKIKIVKEEQNNNDNNAPIQNMYDSNYDKGQKYYDEGQKYIDSTNKNESPKVMDTIIGESVKTGDIIVVVAIIAIILIIINLVYFGVKAKKVEKEDKEKSKKYKRVLIISMVICILLMIIVVILAKNVIAFEGNSIEEIIEILRKENEDNPESTAYLVTDKTISHIPAGTTIETLEDKVENIEIKNQNKTANLKTGMIAEYKENGRTYEISVLGDINEDGILNQIDLTMTIREYLEGRDLRIEKEVGKISADITCDGKIDEEDIDYMIDYILQRDLESEEEVQSVTAPKMEIIEGSGKYADQGRYITNVKLKLIQENEESKTEKTIYKITGSQTTEEKQINKKEEIIELTQSGVYKITSYSYGKEGNKSKGTSSIIVIEETPKIQINLEETTKGPIKVTIEEKEGYDIEYKVGDGEWIKYDKEFEIDENTTITTRVVDETGKGVENKTEITNIDNLPPKTFTPTATSTTNSIIVTGSTSDAETTDKSACSGMSKYYFSKDNGTTWEPIDGTTDTTYTFNGLTQNQNYDVKMKAIDNVGNEIITEAVTVATKGIPNLSNEEGKKNVTITSSPSEMTKEDVTVTIATTVGEGYTLQYSKDRVTWNDYTGEGIVFENNGPIYARLTDGRNNGEYVTENISNIDKLPPNTFTLTGTSTSNSITIEGSTTDQEETPENACSGIAKYYYSKNNGTTWEPLNGTTENSYTFNDLTQNETYDLKMKAVDNVGNETITKTLTMTTRKVPTLTDEEGKKNVEFNYSPSEITKEDVTVTIETTAGADYTLQYTIDDPTDATKWRDYPVEGIVFEKNGVIHVRLKDSEGQVGDYITENVTNIDKLPPNTFTATATSKTSKITLEGSTTDQEATQENACSEVAKYYYSKDNGKTWEPTEGTTESSYTFNDLTQKQEYKLKMKAVDNAENETITETVTKSTESMPDLTEEEGKKNVEFNYSPNQMTKENVTVTITTTVGDEYTLQYTTGDPTDETKWANYPTEGVIVEQNGRIYARLTDGTNGGGYVIENITNIDKLLPKVFTATASSTTNSVTIEGSTTDQEGTPENACSGIAKYYYSIDEGATWKPEEGTTNTRYTFNGLTHNQIYKLKMKAVDNAGNERITEIVTETTKVMPNLTEEEGKKNVEFNYSTSEMTKEDVIVTIETTVGDNYTIQYTTDDPNDETKWKDYPAGGVTFKENGTIHVRVTDGTNSGGYVTKDITNIDKKAPTASIVLSGTETKTEENIQATVTQSDNENGSGINITNCKWIYTTNSSEIGTDETNYTGGSFIETPQVLNLSTSTEGTYYLHVLSIDQVGNKKETISDAVLVEKKILKDGSWTGEVNSPRILEEMQPYYYNEENSNVFLGDNSTDEEWENWYNYIAGDNKTDTGESKWANARLIKDGLYTDFVWIPRYEYKISGVEGTNTAGKVDVKFIPTSQTEPDEGYKIHPAFIDGTSNNFKNGEWDSELSGFWINKFQTTTNIASADIGYEEGTLKIGDRGAIIYSNSDEGMSIGDYYDMALNYDREKESHMMKNSEWGAVVYLACSQYGRNGELVTANNSHTVGSSQDEFDLTSHEIYPWVSEQGKRASSTKNIYGVYDLAGACPQYVAGYIANGSSNISTYGKTMITVTDNDSEAYKTRSTKYVTIYPNEYNIYKNLKSENYGYGDAILETTLEKDNVLKSWFKKYDYEKSGADISLIENECKYYSQAQPFLIRGSKDGMYCMKYSSQFSFYNRNGSGKNATFRVVLAGNN